MSAILTRRASFYRGGTSRGLIFGDMGLAPYSQVDRDRMICAASSPDPDGRQIDGLGGGVSSLSKVAIVHSSGSIGSRLARDHKKAFPGLDWLDNKRKVSAISDIVYRFGQVSIKTASIDWGSTCGNMIAAAAHYALINGTVNRIDVLGHLPPAVDITQQDKGKYYAHIRVIAHDTGKVVLVRVPVQCTFSKQFGTNRWQPKVDGDCRIAGVPGTGPGIIVESPLEGSVLSTGNERDTIEIDGQQIDVSIVDTGLPVVFVSAKSLGIPLSSLLEHPATIDSNLDLMAKLERVRQKACTLTPQLQDKLSPPSPKICVIHPRCSYTTTGGIHTPESAMDVMARVVSTGQLHRTIPATTLSALAACLAFKNSVVCQEMLSDPCDQTMETLQEAGSGTNLRAITVGQPAGCSSASVAISPDTNQPKSIVMLRTARRIFEGQIQIPFTPMFDRNVIDKYQEQRSIKRSRWDESEEI